MVKYIVTVGKSLHEQFPEMDFIIENTSFLDPSLRQLQQASIKLLTDRFHTGKEPFVFDSSIIGSEYAMYRNVTCNTKSVNQSSSFGVNFMRLKSTNN